MIVKHFYAVVPTTCYYVLLFLENKNFIQLYNFINYNIKKKKCFMTIFVPLWKWLKTKVSLIILYSSQENYPECATVLSTVLLPIQYFIFCSSFAETSSTNPGIFFNNED